MLTLLLLEKPYINSSTHVYIMSIKKICRHCKHFQSDTSKFFLSDKLRFGICKHPSALIENPIHGKQEQTYASIFRMSGNTCGKDANLFESFTDEITRFKLFKREHTFINLVLETTIFSSIFYTIFKLF